MIFSTSEYEGPTFVDAYIRESLSERATKHTWRYYSDPQYKIRYDAQADYLDEVSGAKRRRLELSIEEAEGEISQREAWIEDYKRALGEL